MSDVNRLSSVSNYIGR